AVLKRNKRNSITCKFRSVPRSMQSHERAVSITFWELRAGVKAKSDCGRMRRQKNVRYDGALNKVRPLAFVFRVVIAADIGVWPTVESAILDGRNVIGYEIVSEGVALVHRDPHRVRARLQCERHWIAQPGSEHAMARPIGVVFVHCSAARF